MKKAWTAVLCTTLWGTAGCDYINAFLESDHDIPVTGESPDVTLDLSEQVRKLEDNINQKKDDGDDERRNYLLLKSLCETEPDATNPTVNKDCSAPGAARLPIRVPRFSWPFGCITGTNPPVFHPPQDCTMPLTCQPTDQATMEALLATGTIPNPPPSGNGCVDVSAWIRESEDYEDMRVQSQATKFDVSTQGSLKDVQQVKKVTITRVTMRFKENSLTYAIPTTTYFVGAPVSDERVQDSKLLIMEGTVAEFGTLTEIAAAYTGDEDMSLQPEGKGRLSDALRGFKATVAAQATMDLPPETEMPRVDNCKEAGHRIIDSDFCESWPKPGGQVKLAVRIDVTFTVNLTQ